MNKIEKNILMAVIGLILIILMCMAVYYWFSFKSVDNEIADIVNKGNTFMAEQNYDAAIECYQKALDYEENNEMLNMAIIEAFMEKGQSLGDTDDAIIAYLTAISLKSDNKTAYWNIADIYERRGEEDNMLETLRQGYIDTGDSSMDNKVAAIENERARIKAEEEAAALAMAQEAEKEAEEAAEREHNMRMLEPLVALFKEEDYDGLKDIMRQEDYIEYSDGVIGDKSYYHGEYDSDGKRHGIGIAVYEGGYYYYGDFDNDVRSGHGIYMRASYADSSSIGSFIFEGNWADDAPNGDGVATSNYYKDRISGNDFATKEISGNYKNGLEDGTMTLKGTTKSGVSRTFTYTAVEGIAEKSSNDDSGIAGQYIISQTSNKSDSLTSDGSQRGVEGFVEEE